MTENVSRYWTVLILRLVVGFRWVGGLNGSNIYWRIASQWVEKRARAVCDSERVHLSLERKTQLSLEALVFQLLDTLLDVVVITQQVFHLFSTRSCRGICLLCTCSVPDNETSNKENVERDTVMHISVFLHQGLSSEARHLQGCERISIIP